MIDSTLFLRYPNFSEIQVISTVDTVTSILRADLHLGAIGEKLQAQVSFGDTSKTFHSIESVQYLRGSSPRYGILLAKYLNSG